MVVFSVRFLKRFSTVKKGGVCIFVFSKGQVVAFLKYVCEDNRIRVMPKEKFKQTEFFGLQVVWRDQKGGFGSKGFKGASVGGPQILVMEFWSHCGFRWPSIFKGFRLYEALFFIFFPYVFPCFMFWSLQKYVEQRLAKIRWWQMTFMASSG